MSGPSGGRKRRDSDSSSSLFRQFSSIRRFDSDYTSFQASSSSFEAESDPKLDGKRTRGASKDKKAPHKKTCPHCEKVFSKSSNLSKHIDVSKKDSTLNCRAFRILLEKNFRILTNSVNLVSL